MQTIFLVLLAALSAVPGSDGQLIEEMYCGKENCYKVLGADADSTIGEIKKLYRKLARTVHPDRPGGSSEAFQRVATAYETLGDEEGKKNYDYYLAHPGDAIYNQYRYYRHRAAPKVDVTPILVVMMTVTSVCQYLHWSNGYSTAIAQAWRVKKIQKQAKEEAKSQGLLEGVPKGQHEAIFKKVIADNLDLHGSFAPPNWMDVAWVQLLILPYTVAMYFWVKHIRWHYRYSINAFDPAEYEDDRDYLICRNLKMSMAKFRGQQPEEIETILERELWIAGNAAAFIKKQQEEAHEKMKNSTRYKWEKRWKKKNNVA